MPLPSPTPLAAKTIRLVGGCPRQFPLTWAPPVKADDVHFGDSSSFCIWPDQSTAAQDPDTCQTARDWLSTSAATQAERRPLPDRDLIRDRSPFSARNPRSLDIFE